MALLLILLRSARCACLCYMCVICGPPALLKITLLLGVPVVVSSVKVRDIFASRVIVLFVVIKRESTSPGSSFILQKRSVDYVCMYVGIMYVCPRFVERKT